MHGLLIFGYLCSLGAAVFFAGQYRAISNRFKDVLSLDEEAVVVKKEIERRKAEALQEIQRAEVKAAELTLAYNQAKEIYNRLQFEISLRQPVSETMSFGLYKPQYAFDTSEAYKAALEQVYEKKKACIHDRLAATSPKDWTVNNSAKEGRKFIEQEIKIMLRAFNAECDAAIANVGLNNATRMAEQIHKSFRDINTLGEVTKTQISGAYLDLCLSELRLTYEHGIRLKEFEKDSERIREEREKKRDEEQAQKDFQRVQQEAAKEKSDCEKALATAQEILRRATGKRHEITLAEIASLMKKIADAQARSDHAASMAQNSKMGYVHVVSDIGSLGENVFKVSRSRRLLNEGSILHPTSMAALSGGNVHGAILSEDARSLEAEIHTAYSDRLLDLAGQGRQCFQVTIEELAEFAQSKGLKVEFIKTAGTTPLLAKTKADSAEPRPGQPAPAKEEAFPEQLFAPANV